MSQVKETSEEDTTELPADLEEHGPSITSTEADNRVVDVALYGLKHGPRVWYERLSRFLLENGFTRGKIDNTLFLKKTREEPVDDIILGATNDTLCEEFAKLMGKLLKRFEMEISKTIDTLIATATHLDMDEPGSPVNETIYHGIIGSLLYPAANRPDIVLSVGLCARFQSSPK
uniref:Reverse transcriptase Ty1/copia-type domain-containing protein n=1 Tax=Nicotiana tabacum TaxID=4097 RepID=A0A1S3Z1C3_TOBAC|nr:PREDICTED: uncharacterized protein LOC107781716 [Nicotiana tabacum]